MQKLTVRYRLLTILLLLLLPSLSLHAQDEPVVREIVIQGLKTIKPEQVSSVMTSRVGLRSSPEMRREDLNSILALGFFTEDVKFYREPVEDGIRIIVRVRENPKVEEIGCRPPRVRGRT
ncbi:MAG TPA: POTRA domain-containing protein [Candidatus Sumerlaeota bacterium]|nr:POTRA domain-containing protein [Candidatus Sumerlaeota bacterium]